MRASPGIANPEIVIFTRTCATIRIDPRVRQRDAFAILDHQLAVRVGPAIQGLMKIGAVTSKTLASVAAGPCFPPSHDADSDTGRA